MKRALIAILVAAFWIAGMALFLVVAMTDDLDRMPPMTSTDVSINPTYL